MDFVFSVEHNRSLFLCNYNWLDYSNFKKIIQKLHKFILLHSKSSKAMRLKGERKKSQNHLHLPYFSYHIGMFMREVAMSNLWTNHSLSCWSKFLSWVLEFLNKWFNSQNDSVCKILSGNPTNLVSSSESLNDPITVVNSWKGRLSVKNYANFSQ